MEPNEHILATHNQLYDKSCIPMAIEYVLKEHNIISPDFFGYQNDYQKHGVSAWKSEIHVDQIKFTDLEELTPEEALNILNYEFAQGRMVMMALEYETGNWHMWVAYKENEDGTFELVTSTKGLGHSLVENKDLRSWLPQMSSFSMITYELL